MLIADLNHTIDIWIRELKRYTFTDLCAKPSADSWSPGQLFLHLINDTDFYIEQIKTCVSSDDNVNEEASPGAKAMFRKNDFPDEAIEGAPANAYIPQPLNKEQLVNGLTNLKHEITIVETLISESTFKGKTKHPGLGYFNAYEWLQFAEMHFRHHLRQKKRIDNFLKTRRR